MPSVSEMFPSEYLEYEDIKPAIDAGKRAVVVIERVECSEMWDTQLNQNVPKWMLKFNGKKKKMILSKTNAKRIAKVTGSDDSDGWAGATIELTTEAGRHFGQDFPHILRVWTGEAPKMARRR